MRSRRVYQGRFPNGDVREFTTFDRAEKHSPFFNHGTPREPMWIHIMEVWVTEERFLEIAHHEAA